jgi:quinol monooxygenase YgiN
MNGFARLAQRLYATDRHFCRLAESANTCSFRRYISQMIYVVIYVDIQPSSVGGAIALLMQYREHNSTTAGHFWTSILQELSRPNRFVVVEAWKDEASVQAHQQLPNTLEYQSRLNAIHNSPFDRRVHSEFAAHRTSSVSRADALHVVTHVDVPPPRKDETEVLLKTLGEQSRNDQGNLGYDVFQQLAPRTNHFTVFAVWINDTAYVSHEAEPHTRKFRESLGPMLGAPYDERWYRKLD